MQEEKFRSVVPGLPEIERMRATIERQARELEQAREALEPFAAICRAAQGELKPHMFMHDPSWYMAAAAALAQAGKDGGKDGGKE